MKIKTGDIFIIITALCFITLFTFFVYSHPKKENSCRIIASEKEYIYPLEEDRDIEINGPLGVSHIHIENSSVSMVSSPCPLKICMDSGSISRSGEWIACLPNKILIIIKGKKDEEPEVDIISQ